MHEGQIHWPSPQLEKCRIAGKLGLSRFVVWRLVHLSMTALSAHLLKWWTVALILQVLHHQLADDSCSDIVEGVSERIESALHSAQVLFLSGMVAMILLRTLHRHWVAFLVRYIPSKRGRIY